MKKIIALTLAATLLTTPVFATTLTETQKSDTAKQLEELRQKFIISQQPVTEVPSSSLTSEIPSGTHSFKLKVVDKYGNILATNTKWSGSTSATAPIYVTHDDKQYSQVMNISRPYNYKTVNTRYDLTTKNKLHTLLLQPSQLMNIVSGKLILQQGTLADDVFIQAIPQNKDKIQDAVLKVQKDGSFKIENLMDGTYIFQAFIGSLDYSKNQSIWNYLKIFEPVKVTIKGNTQIPPIALNEKATNKIPDINSIKQEANGAVYFKDINRTSPMLFATHTQSSNPPALVKDIAKDIIQKTTTKTDLQKLEEVLKELHAHAELLPNGFGSGTLDQRVKGNKLIYNNCGDFADSFISLCREVNLPTIYVQSTVLGPRENIDYVKAYQSKENLNAGAHEIVEVYLPDQDKWVLVEPHFCKVMTNYDPTNPYVLDGELYFYYIKSPDSNFSRPHEFVLGNYNSALSFNAQEYDKDYPFEQ